MDKYENNALVEELDEIILLNDNYADRGLCKGCVGIVMSNLIEKDGFVVADFESPKGEKYNQPVIEIRKEDFRVMSDSVADHKLWREFREMFREKDER